MALRKEVVVLGGGISGLTAAWSIVRESALRSFRGSSQPCPKITIVEGNQQVGGCIKTHYGPGGTVLEQGPHGMRPSGHAGRATLNMLASVGMSNQVIVAGKDHPGAKNRFIYANSRLQKLPTGLGEVARNITRRDPLTLALVKGLLLEPFRSAAKAGVSDESVYDFATRRLGKDVADRMIDPLCVGIYGGDCRTLSLKSSFKILADFEQMEGSLVLGGIRQDRNTPPLPPPEPGTEWLLNRVDGARIWSLERGLADLPLGVRRWLEETGNVEFRLGQQCSRLTHADNGSIGVELDGEEVLNADHVVSAIPARAIGPILRASDPNLASAAASIPTNSIVVANYLFRGRLLDVDGFGYLVPTTEPENGVLGVVFDSCSFPQQDDAAFLDAEVGAVTRLTVMTGGPKFTDVYGSGGEVDSATVHAVSLAALRKHLGITVEPMHSAIMPWVDCMPQYTVGHSDRVANIKAAALAGWGGHLSVTGSSFHGVGVNDCVLAATKLGKTLVESGRV
eukprot:m.91545 g.91545  ORF g.91545 m.91545 type:complete len:509 (-) comp20185_c0_seq15:149-1675(-)